MLFDSVRQSKMPARVLKTTGGANLKFWRNIIRPVTSTQIANVGITAAEGKCGCNECIDVCTCMPPAVWCFCRGFSPGHVGFHKYSSRGVDTAGYKMERLQNQEYACRGYHVRSHLSCCNEVDPYIVDGN